MAKAFGSSQKTTLLFEVKLIVVQGKNSTRFGTLHAYIIGIVLGKIYWLMCEDYLFALEEVWPRKRLGKKHQMLIDQCLWKVVPTQMMTSIDGISCNHLLHVDLVLGHLISGHLKDRSIIEIYIFFITWRQVKLKIP